MSVIGRQTVIRSSAWWVGQYVKSIYPVKHAGSVFHTVISLGIDRFFYLFIAFLRDSFIGTGVIEWSNPEDVFFFPLMVMNLTTAVKEDPIPYVVPFNFIVEQVNYELHGFLTNRAAYPTGYDNNDNN